MTLAATDTLVRISVADHGPQPPCVCRLGPGENWIGEEVTEHGRGLVLVDRLVGGCGGHWGFNRDGRGSAVWFELHADDHPRRIGGPAAYPANAATVDEAAQRASQAARTLDQAYRAWRHTHGLTDPAEISALGYVASLVRLRSADRVLFGIPAHESDVLARFLAVHSEPEGA